MPDMILWGSSPLLQTIWAFHLFRGKCEIKIIPIKSIHNIKNVPHIGPHCIFQNKPSLALSNRTDLLTSGLLVLLQYEWCMPIYTIPRRRFQNEFYSICFSAVCAFTCRMLSSPTEQFCRHLFSLPLFCLCTGKEKGKPIEGICWYCGDWSKDQRGRQCFFPLTSEGLQSRPKTEKWSYCSLPLSCVFGFNCIYSTRISHIWAHLCS